MKYTKEYTSLTLKMFLEFYGNNKTIEEVHVINKELFKDKSLELIIEEFEAIYRIIEDKNAILIPITNFKYDLVSELNHCCDDRGRVELLMKTGIGSKYILNNFNDILDMKNSNLIYLDDYTENFLKHLYKFVSENYPCKDKYLEGHELDRSITDLDKEMYTKLINCKHLDSNLLKISLVESEKKSPYLVDLTTGKVTSVSSLRKDKLKSRILIFDNLYDRFSVELKDGTRVAFAKRDSSEGDVIDKKLSLPKEIDIYETIFPLNKRGELVISENQFVQLGFSNKKISYFIQEGFTRKNKWVTIKTITELAENIVHEDFIKDGQLELYLREQELSMSYKLFGDIYESFGTEIEKEGYPLDALDNPVQILLAIIKEVIKRALRKDNSEASKEWLKLIDDYLQVKTLGYSPSKNKALKDVLYNRKSPPMLMGVKDLVNLYLNIYNDNWNEIDLDNCIPDFKKEILKL